MKVEIEEQFAVGRCVIIIEIDETPEHNLAGKDRNHLYTACASLLEEVKQAARSAYTESGEQHD